MKRIGILAVLLLTISVFAAEDDVVFEPDSRPAVEEEEEQGGIDLDTLEDIDINSDHTQDDEDIFVPTEEVSFQQSVPFPTDI